MANSMKVGDAKLQGLLRMILRCQVRESYEKIFLFIAVMMMLISSMSSVYTGTSKFKINLVDATVEVNSSSGYSSYKAIVERMMKSTSLILL